MTKSAKFATVSLLLLGPLAAKSSTTPELGSIYDKALREVRAGYYEQALKDLDAIDTLTSRAEDKAEALNLRGLILTRQCEYEGAEIVLRRAIEIDPKSWNASFNLAEISFLKKDWAEARRRFAAMVADGKNGLEEGTRQLIKYKILLTCVLDGKEALAHRMLDQQAQGSPAFYYAQAAIARQQGKEADATNWMVSAAELFSADVAKLYAESFYEIGWEKRPPGEGRESFEIVPTEERAARTEAAAWANFAAAQQAFLERRTEAALKLLDGLDAALPGQAVSYNLRGEILMEERKLDAAETMLCKALSADPKLREAAYNLAQIAFKKKDYAKARDQLELLFAETPGGETQAAQLIKFEIFLTFLLEGKESQAHQMMDQFKFTGATPALYYARAAWTFQHADPERGNGWIDAARRIYSAALNIVFADSFYDLGWLEHPPEENSPAPAMLAGLSTGPSEEIEEPTSSPHWRPEMLLSMNRWSSSLGKSLEVALPLHEIVPSLTLIDPPNDGARADEAPFPILSSP